MARNLTSSSIYALYALERLHGATKLAEIAQEILTAGQKKFFEIGKEILESW